jgi:hypothetical protein
MLVPEGLNDLPIGFGVLLWIKSCCSYAFSVKTSRLNENSLAVK